MRNTFVIAIVIVILAVLAFFIVSNKKSEAPTPEINITAPVENEGVGVTNNGTISTDPNSGAPVPPAAVKSFTVTGKNFAFSPTTMTVNKGDRVRVTLNDIDGNHDFVIDEFNAKTKVLKSGESETIEFIADKAGTFEYYCSVGTHRQMGMKGTLTVVE